MQLALHALDGSLATDRLPFALPAPASPSASSSSSTSSSSSSSSSITAIQQRLRTSAAALLESVLAYDFQGNAIDIVDENRAVAVQARARF